MYFKKMQRSLAEKDPPQGVRAFFKQGQDTAVEKTALMEELTE